MARNISVDRDSFWRKFNSLDLFTRLFIITVILLSITSPFIVYNYQIFNARGESEAERLQEIQQLQGTYSGNLLTKSQTTPDAYIPAAVATPKQDAGFNLMNVIRRIFNRIGQMFK